MSTLVIYGASDDLIEVKGIVSDELNPPYGEPAIVTVKVNDVAYARLHVEFDPDQTGEWRIQPTAPGDLVVIVAARGEAEADDYDGCPGYSDKAVLDMGAIEDRRISVSTTPEATS